MARKTSIGEELVYLRYPIFFALIMWAVFVISAETGIRLSHYGLFPRTSEGILGILTMPFLHGSYAHLINNTIPVLVLGWALFRFYPTLAWKTIFGIWIISGIWLWISGRSSYHIGASGIVYGLAAFLFLSGWLRLEKRVAALSLLIAFLYGGLWWGVLPVDPAISWEGHFWGALSGFALAFYLRKEGPQRPVYQWDDEDETGVVSESSNELSEPESATDAFTLKHEHISQQSTTGINVTPVYTIRQEKGNSNPEKGS